jgi:hypothetical protein
MVGGRPTQLQVTRRLVRKAASRAMLGRFVSLLGTALAIAGGLLLVAVIIGKLAGQSFGLLLPGVVAGVGALLAASIVATMGRWSEQRAAIEIDRVLGLDDALASALDLEHDAAHNDEAFRTLALRDAEQTAARVDPKVVTPIGLGAGWVAWPIVGALAVGASMFIPALQRDRAGGSPSQLAVLPDQAAAEVKAAIDAVAETVADEADETMAATPEQLEVLDELERELASGETTADEAVQRAASVLDERADALEENAIDEALTQDALVDKLDAVDPASLDQALDLAEALRNGDLDAARRAVREMARTLDDLSPEERRRLADDLGRLAEQLDEAGVDAPDPGASEPGNPLEDLGLTPEEAQQLADETDSQEIAEQLDAAGVDPPEAQRLAEEIAEQNRERQAQQRARDEAQRMRESLEQASEQLKEPPAEPQEQPTPPDVQEQPNESQGDQPEDDPSGQGDESKPRDQQGETESPDPSKPDAGTPETNTPDPSQPGQETGEEEGQEQGQKQGEQQTPGNEPSKPDPSGQPDQTGDKQGDQPDPAGEKTGEGQKPDPAKPGEQQPGEQPSGQQPSGEQPSGQEPSEQETPGQSPGEGEKPSTEPGTESGAKPGDQQPGNQQQGQEPGAKPGEQLQPGAEQGPEQGTQQGTKPGEETGAQPGSEGAPGDESNPQGTGPTPGDESRKPTPREALENLERQFDRLGDARDRAQDDRASARELRERAQEMLEQMSPEERKEMLDRWAQAQRDRQDRARRADGSPTDSQLPSEAATDPFTNPTNPPADRVDMSRPGKEATDRVIARWLGEGEGDPDPAAKRAFSSAVRRSRDSAEQAFEQQRIPRRHQDLIRRVFDRFAARAQEQASPQSPPETTDPGGN